MGRGSSRQQGRAGADTRDSPQRALEARDHGLAELAKQLGRARECEHEGQLLENLGQEMDKKDHRIRSLQEMRGASENEFKGMQEMREREVRVKDKTTPPQRALEPKLQLSARSARSREKENEGPRGI